MSLTINGATNTLTAASGLTIAGDTAVTGTLSASGSISSTSNAASTLNLTGAGANTPSHVLLRNTTAGGASPGVQFYNGDGYRHYFQEGIGTAGLNLVAVDGTPFNIAANTAVTGTLSATTSVQGGPNGGGGLILQTYTGGTFGAIYSTTVTPGATNYSLISTGANTYLNGTVSTNLTVGNTVIAAASSTGLAVTGTLSATATSNGAVTAGLTVANNGAGAGTGAKVSFYSGAEKGYTSLNYDAVAGWRLDSNAENEVRQLVNGTVKATLSSTALTLGSGVNLVGAGSLISSGANTVVAASQTVVDNSSSVARFIAFGPDAGTNATVRLLSVRSDGSGSVPYDFGPTSLTMPTGVNLVMASGQGIDFSATSNGSGTTTSEVLSDYEEGTWTPALTWSTPGDQSFAYSTQAGTYTKVGRLVTCSVAIVTSTHTYSTATGALQISGLPFTAGATAYEGASAHFAGITKASYTAVGLQVGSGSTVASFVASGSGQAVANIVPADVPSGTQVTYRATFSYIV